MILYLEIQKYVLIFVLENRPLKEDYALSCFSLSLKGIIHGGQKFGILLESSFLRTYGNTYIHGAKLKECQFECKYGTKAYFGPKLLGTWAYYTISFYNLDLGLLNSKI